MNLSQLKIPSPIQQVVHPLLDKYGVELFVKREDMIHPDISGNKWRKLKYNLKYAGAHKIKTLVTFGGAFSNHLYAFAAACELFGFRGVAIVRGEADVNNPTTAFVNSKGIDLHYISRSAYRMKENSEEVEEILSSLDHYMVIPEGGSNDLAQRGLVEMVEEINTTDFDTLLVSLGTGATCLSLLQNLAIEKSIFGYSSLKSDYHWNEMAEKVSTDQINRFSYYTDYHFGGYGKTNDQLVDFINEFTRTTDIPIDPIYNSKIIFGFFDQLKDGQIDQSKKYLWLHTGGLQGIAATNYLARKKGDLLIHQ